MGGLESVFKLSLIMSMVDNLTGPMGRAVGSTQSAVSSLQAQQQTLGNTAKYGAMAAAAGGAIANAGTDLVKSTFDTQRAIGELSSLGVRDLDAIEAAARRFSTTWAGTYTADFIAAAYDIKSGIASLSDEGVAQYTELAGVTAKATKSTIAEMTSLYATGYSIYKGLYADMTDLQFGEMFAGALATSVKQFKTTGSGMAQAIQMLGGSAATAKIPMEEQLAVLGMLQATMSGSEAGTKYKAFIRSAVRGGNELGLSFTDANNQLLPMSEILDKLHTKFGSTMDAAEKMQLQKAFGDQEAVALIDLLYNKTGDLTGNIDTLQVAMGGGSAAAVEMAEAINSMAPDQYDLTWQSIQNLSESLGNSLQPAFLALNSAVLPVINGLTEWVNQNQGLVSGILITITVLGGLLAVCGTGAVVLGGLGMVVGGVKSGILLLHGVLVGLPSVIGGVVTSVWSFTAALLANPVTWIVIGIVALIAALVLLRDNWDAVCSWCSNVWSSFCSGVQAGVDGIKDFFTGMINWCTDAIQWFGDCGRKIIDTLVGGIMSVASAPVDAICGIFDEIRKYLPFSDAKKGPLSHLTLSGRRIMTTLSTGVELERDAPAEAIEASLGKADSRIGRAGGKLGSLEFRRQAPAQETQTPDGVPQDYTGLYIDKLYIQTDISKLSELPLLQQLLQEVQDYARDVIPAKESSGQKMRVVAAK